MILSFRIVKRYKGNSLVWFKNTYYKETHYSKACRSIYFGALWLAFNIVLGREEGINTYGYFAINLKLALPKV